MTESGRPSIYGLADPRTGEVRYIGKANNPERRLKGHKREASRRRTPLYDWMRKLAAEGISPQLLIIEADCVDWQEAERRLIAEARARGDRILNLADGGEQPFCPAEVRSENGHRLVQLLRDNPDALRLREAKRNLATALRDGLVRNATRERMRALAAAMPQVLGDWAALQDREENDSGEPVGGYGRVKGGRLGAPLQANP